MSKYDKILEDIFTGKKDNNINFNELCGFLERLGFKLERISGSHHIFSYENIVADRYTTGQKRTLKSKSVSGKTNQEIYRKISGGMICGIMKL